MFGDYHDLQAQIDKLKKRCCCNIFAATTLNPPVDAPGAGEANVLINYEEGIIWYWDGDSWAEYGYEPLYQVYAANFSQSFTDPPVVTVFENTLIDSILWANVTDGIYRGTCTGCFPSGKTMTITNGASYEDQNSNVTIGRDNDNEVRLVVSVEWGLQYGAIVDHPIEIRVYP